MTLEDYYFCDPRLILIPVEHLGPPGIRPEFAEVLARRAAWSLGRVALFNHAFSLYWARSAALAQRTTQWPWPRLRHVAVVHDPHGIRPYAQLLNTGAWTLYDSDIDPMHSHPELAAYILVHADRMALSGEVTMAAVQCAAYWFERTDAECAAFAQAASRADRLDADGFRAVAAALPWLRRLGHERLRPVAQAGRCRAVPGTGLLVPRDLESFPPVLVQQWTGSARRAVSAFHRTWHAPDDPTVAALCEWLSACAPPLLIVARGHLIWDPRIRERVGAVRAELRRASGAAVRDILADLRTIAARTHAFLDSLIDPTALPPPDPATEQCGYAYLHRGRKMIAYDLHEPDIERLQGPALPYARAMLAARTVHEWAHLAADAGWVPPRADTDTLAALTNTIAAELDAAVTTAPPSVRALTRSDLEQLRRDLTPGVKPANASGLALVRLLVTRMPDFQANLLGHRYLTLAESETYVRQNVRTLRAQYSAPQLWRMLVRYLYEFQYVRFSAVADARAFFVRSTGFDVDFFRSGVLSEAQFDALTGAVARFCETYRVDETRFHPARIIDIECEIRNPKLERNPKPEIRMIQTDDS